MAPPETEEKRLAIVEEHMKKCWFIKLGNDASCFRLKMNPIVSLVAALSLWGMIILIALAPDHMNQAFTEGQIWVAEGWSWFYIISQDIWVVALIYCALHPRFGKLKLGRDDEVPVFSDITWFSLLFTCGVAVGMFYFVAEPMWHFKGWGGPRFIKAQNGYSNPSEDAVHGMMVTWYHWGVHGWIPYTLVGALLGLLSYRRGFPLSMRFGFYPLIGDRVYGWMGDCIDILSIITTVMGVCTSLGLGTMSINQGLMRLSQGFYRGTSESVPDDPVYEYPTCGGTGHAYWTYVKSCDEKWTADGSAKLYDRESHGVQANMATQALIIVIITLMATTSVVSGLNYGIQELSRLGFAMSIFLLLFVLFTGDTVFQMNLTIQTFGYYIWYLPKIAFHTDAFEFLGTAAMGQGGFGGWKGNAAGHELWMNTWTIFYWGWWISWAPFVGTFLAKVSRGRTIRQFVLWTLVAPSLYCFIWFGTVGGEVTKLQTLADTSGLCSKGWLNGGGKTSPPTSGMTCNLSPEELDITTGKCKDRAGLEAAGLITAADEANCGRGACSGETLKRGYCGKMLPTCNHYTATYSAKQKKVLNLGYTPSCLMQNNGDKHPSLSGACQMFAWKHYEQKMDSCVEITTWVKVPCSGGADPTALAAGSLACNTGTPESAPAWCQDACKSTITKEMVNMDNSARMYNHFTMDSAKSDEVVSQGTYAHIGQEYSGYGAQSMKDVYVADANGVERHKQASCFVPAPDNQVCVYSQKTADILFDLIGSLADSSSLAAVISIIALISLVIYFITSSDSGSLVVDILAANGEEEPPVPQRIFWAFTEGATAIALLYSGKNVLGPYGDPGEGGLRALQAASIIMGLPYTFILFWFAQAFVQVCREEGGDLDPERPRFKMFLMGAPRSDKVAIGQGVAMISRNLFIPGFSPAVQQATKRWPLGSATNGRIWQIVLQGLWMLAFGIGVSGATAFGLFTFGGAIFFIFTCWLSLVRREIRMQWGVPRGDFFTDFICCSIPGLHAFVLTQLEIEMQEECKKYDPQEKQAVSE